MGKAFLQCSKGRRRRAVNLASAVGLVYVAWPLQKQNGFVRILRFGRRHCMDFGVCDQAAISRAWVEGRLYVVLAWKSYSSLISTREPRRGCSAMVTTFQRTRSPIERLVASAIKKPAVHYWPAGFWDWVAIVRRSAPSLRGSARGPPRRGSGATRSCSIVLDRGGVDCGGWRRVRIRG